MSFKFEKLEVWQLAMDLSNKVYDIIENMPKTEQFNLSSQIRRTVTSISLNIAEGSTGQNDSEQVRFLRYAHRSLMEVVACQILMKERDYFTADKYDELYNNSEKLSAKLLAMKRVKTSTLNIEIQQSVVIGLWSSTTKLKYLL